MTTCKILTKDLAMEEDDKVKNEALQIISLHQNLPRLVVFDLDHTFWPFYWYIIYANHCILTPSLFSFFFFSNFYRPLFHSGFVRTTKGFYFCIESVGFLLPEYMYMKIEMIVAVVSV